MRSRSAGIARGGMHDEGAVEREAFAGNGFIAR